MNLKVILVAVVGAVLLLLSVDDLYFRRRQRVPLQYYHTSGSSFTQHPIDLLIQQSRQSFDARLHAQSKTLEDAITAYKERYQIEPPPGFDKWFDFAQTKRSRIIDDFDTINDAVMPFLGVSGERINEMLDEALATKSGMHKCGYRNGAHYGFCGHLDLSW
jgi:hypothetical protein